MSAVHYVYSLAGMELTFRLEFHADPPVSSGLGPIEASDCQVTRAVCLEIFDSARGESRLATPAERLHWGGFLLARIEELPELRREIHARCLAEAEACEPPRRRRRVSARWRRAA